MSVEDVRDRVRANAELALAAIAERLNNVSGPLTLEDLRAVGVEVILERYGRACAKTALDAAGAALSPFDDLEEDTQPYPVDWVDRESRKK